MRIVGYGVCGPNEADKYLENTLKEFKRLCDDVVIVCNNTTEKEDKLIKKYGFNIVRDNREWGKAQNKIKEDFVKKELPKYKPEYCLCLDMDEVFEEGFTRKDLESLTHKASYFYFISFWDNDKHYNPNVSFWNVRFWKYGNESKDFYPQPLHCGLAPKVMYTLGIRVPYYIRHYGLINRKSKIERYDKYDKDARYKGKAYYDELRGGVKKEYNKEEIKKMVVNFVEKYKERIKDKITMEKKEEKIFFVRNPHGMIVPINERHLNETLKRKGFELVGENVVQNHQEVNDIVEDKILIGDELLKKESKEDTNVECDICGFKSKSPGSLRVHKAKHNRK
ncbi:MAG: hypothetical protein IPM48_14500 [Saprospiraceae bacterium]|nr:hypothetical protein [Saprospiraceae bacterium]